MKLRTLPMLTFLLLSSSLHAKVVIWDIGGVLFAPSRMKIAKQVGLSRFLGYWLFDRRNPFTEVQPLVFEVLSSLPCAPFRSHQRPCTDKGTPLPDIMCHWQAGILSGAEIVRWAKAHLNRLETEEFFMSHREKQLVERVIESMFDPHLLAHSMSPLRRTTDIFMDCAHEINPDGSLRNTTIALSNFDPQAFSLLKGLYPHTFSHFDHLVISGNCGYLKPLQNCYSHLINTYGLSPQECIFIDDQKENILAAQQFGFATYHMRGNHRELRNVLIEFGALDY